MIRRPRLKRDIVHLLLQKPMTRLEIEKELGAKSNSVKTILFKLIQEQTVYTELTLRTSKVGPLHINLYKIGDSMPNAVVKVRELMNAHEKPMVLSDIKKCMPLLKSSEISMALAYLTRLKEIEFEMTASTLTKGRKNVKLYKLVSRL